MSTSGYRRYILAMDDSGMQIIRPPTTGQAFFLGGIVIPETQLVKFCQAWRTATKGFELVESGRRPRTAGDIKAIDFLHNHQLEGLVPSRKEAPALAIFAQFAEVFEILPLVLAIPKAEAGNDILGRTKKGEATIRPTEALPMLIGSFGTFLKQRSAYGLARMDRLKNPAEEDEFRASWERQVQGLRKISRQIEFVESADHPEVQAADVLLGLLRGIYERDDGIPRVFGDLLRRAQAAGLWFSQLT